MRALSRQFLWPVLLLLGTLQFSGCTDGAPPLTPEAPAAGVARIALRPHYVVQGAQAVATASLPINRIRLTATTVPGRDTVYSRTFTVSPESDHWNLTLDVPVTGPSIVIVVTVELLNVSGGVESVEFTGTTAPLTLVPAQTRSMTPADVPMVQGPPANLTVTGVRISGVPARVLEGDSAQLTAAVTAAISGARVYWTSLDPQVATVGADGFLRVLRNGSARIVATAGVRADTASFEALQRPVRLVLETVSGNARSLGEELAYTARVLDVRNDAVADAVVEWSIADAAIASVGSDGRFTALRNGTTTVRAVTRGFPDVSATATLTVQQIPASLTVAPGTATLTALGATANFTAAVADARGNAVAGVTVSWSSSANGVASVSSTGTVTANGVGSAVIAASAAGLNASVSVNVRQDIASITLSTARVEFQALQQTATVTAAAFDANQHPIPSPELSWNSSAPGVASVSAAGANATVSAVANGEASVTVRGGGVTASVGVLVRQVVRTLTVAPSNLSFTALGQSAPLSASALDAGGHAVANPDIAWSSSAPHVAAVSPAGVVTAAADGNTTVTASVDGVTASVTAQVIQVPVTVQVTPGSLTFTSISQTAALSAVARDANGHVVGNADFQWSSSNPSVATVTPGGAVRAVASGSASIRAAAGNASASVPVTVRQNVVSLSISPTSVTLGVGQTHQVQASGRDAGGFPVVPLAITWTSSNNAVATVSSSGLIAAVAPGNATITATSGAATVTIAVVVTAAQPATIVLTPASLLLTSIDTTATLHASARDSANNHLPAAVITWTSADTSVARVTPTGVVRAIGPGTTTVTATSGPASASATVVVNQTPHSLQLTAPASLTVGQTGQVGVVVRDFNGHPVAGAQPAFSSSDTTVATVSATGLVTAASHGSVQINVSVGSLVSAVTINVVAVLPDLRPTRVSVCPQCSRWASSPLSRLPSRHSTLHPDRSRRASPFSMRPRATRSMQ